MEDKQARIAVVLSMISILVLSIISFMINSRVDGLEKIVSIQADCIKELSFLIQENKETILGEKEKTVEIILERAGGKYTNPRIISSRVYIQKEVVKD